MNLTPTRGVNQHKFGVLYGRNHIRIVGGFMTPFEITSLVISALSSIFVGISVIYLARQVAISRKVHADNHDWNRRISTQEELNEIRKLDTRGLSENFSHLNKIEPIPLQELLTKFEETPALQNELHNLLNRNEGLANGIFLGIFDEKTIKANRRTAMTNSFIKFREYIQYRQDRGSKTVWTAYERLLKNWSQEDTEIHDRDLTGKI